MYSVTANTKRESHAVCADRQPTVRDGVQRRAAANHKQCATDRCVHACSIASHALAVYGQVLGEPSVGKKSIVETLLGVSLVRFILAHGDATPSQPPPRGFA